METRLADFIRNTPAGEEADRILRACVHCGFCNATCPTYQVLGTNWTVRAAESTKSSKFWKGSRRKSKCKRTWIGA